MKELTPTAIVYGNLLVRFRQETLANNTVLSDRLSDAIELFEEEWPEDCERYRAKYSTQRY